MPVMPDVPLLIVQNIYENYERNREPERPYLGMSILGNPCERYLWYAFRWAAPVRWEGRMLRIFETGKIEEERVIKNLRDAGCIVRDQQKEVSLFGGLVQGHIDGIVEGLPDAPSTPHLLEVKTSNAKNWALLSKGHVESAQPGHFAQIQMYMACLRIERFLYISVNKDTDEIYAERGGRFPEYSDKLISRAGMVIHSHRPLPRISESPAYYTCKYCPYASVCHARAPMLRGCRTCKHFAVDDDHVIRCDLWPSKTPKVEFQRIGCEKFYEQNKE